MRISGTATQTVIEYCPAIPVIELSVLVEPCKKQSHSELAVIYQAISGLLPFVWKTLNELEPAAAHIGNLKI